MKITMDTHIHTPASKCCTNPEQTVEKTAQELYERGFKVIAFTDHVWRNPEILPNHWYAQHDGSALLETVKIIRSRKFPLKVMASCEADMQAPGRFGITDELSDQLDFVMLAPDHFQLRDFVEQPVPPVPEALAPLMMHFFHSAVSWGKAQILAHPMCPFSYFEIYDRTVELISDSEFLDSFGKAAEKGIGLEINIDCLNSAGKGEFNLDTMTRIFSLAKNAGCKFTFGSDSHNAEHFTHYAEAERFSKIVGITEKDLHPLVQI